MSKNRKWWQPSNPKRGLLGVLHATKNIPVEALRRALSSIGANPMLGGKDLARRIVDVLVVALALLAVAWLLGVLSGRPLGGALQAWWE